MMKHNLGSPSLPSEPAGRTPEQTNNLNDERQRGLSLDGARRSGLSMNCSPQSGLSLNDARRSGLSRLGLSCLSLLLVAALLTVGVTASKYTSEATVTIPPLTAASFAFNAEMMTEEEKAAYQAELALPEKQFLACAFTVSNCDADGTVCEVDMTCDLDLQCQFVVDLSKSYWFNFVLGQLPELMKNQLKINLYVDGELKEGLIYEGNINNTSGDVPFDAPMADDPVTGYANELPFTMNFILRDSDAISFKSSDLASKKRCAIVIDATEYNHQEGSLFRQPQIAPTITITANQVKGGA